MMCLGASATETPKKPKKFLENIFDTNFFGGNQREAFTKIIFFLSTKYGNSAGTGSIRFFNTVVENFLDKFEVLSHQLRIINYKLRGS